VPTRPPTVANIQAPDEASLNRAFQIFNQRLGKAELLIGYEGDAFSHTGDVEQDLLSILAVHPMREAAVKKFIQKAGAEASLVKQLVQQGKIKKVEFANQYFYTRMLSA
jgi:wyosine [tRNA(Phe)-imidazoG37] synthetase (radical SAM superfamily)